LECLKVNRNGRSRQGEQKHSEGAQYSHLDPLPKGTIYVLAYSPLFAARLSKVSPCHFKKVGQSASALASLVITIAARKTIRSRYHFTPSPADGLWFVVVTRQLAHAPLYLDHVYRVDNRAGASVRENIVPEMAPGDFIANDKIPRA
jgi:hypothetical protein